MCQVWVWEERKFKRDFKKRMFMFDKLNMLKYGDGGKKEIEEIPIF